MLDGGRFALQRSRVEPKPELQAPRAGLPLKDLPEVESVVVAKLAANWLHTAEEVLGAAASPSGRRGLQRLLECDEAVLDRLLATLAAKLRPAVAARASTAVPPRMLGVILPPEATSPPGPPPVNDETPPKHPA